MGTKLIGAILGLGVMFMFADMFPALGRSKAVIVIIAVVFIVALIKRSGDGHNSF